MRTFVAWQPVKACVFRLKGLVFAFSSQRGHKRRSSSYQGRALLLRAANARSAANARRIRTFITYGIVEGSVM